MLLPINVIIKHTQTHYTYIDRSTYSNLVRVDE